MDNLWGVNYGLADMVNNRSRICHRTIHEFDLRIRETVPTFMLNGLYDNGSTANESAIAEATGDQKPLCLFALGSYIGGSKGLTDLSSGALAGNQLSFPISPTQATATCLAQTIPLPYHMQCSSVTKESIRAYERACYHSIERKLVFAELSGPPYKALLMELMLAGNGATLSDAFLKELAFLCQQHQITIIVDEIMTGGRVGPSMTTTQRCPVNFQNQVKYITLGKIFHCGIVLEKVPKRPQEGRGRGFSIPRDPSAAFLKWREMESHLEQGSIESRQRQVRKLVRANDEEEMWGGGLLLFTTKTRSWVQKGLNNRLLPKVTNAPLQLGSNSQSKWTRSTVCQALMEATFKWIGAINDTQNRNNPFLLSLVDFNLANRNPEFTFTTEEFLSFVGMEEAEEMAKRQCDQEKKEKEAWGGKCTKKAKTFARDAINLAMTSSPRAVTKARKGKRRQTKYHISMPAAPNFQS